MSEMMRYASRTAITNAARSSPCRRLQMRSGILHGRTVQPTSFDARLHLIVGHIARVGLPTTSTPAKSSQAHERDEH